MGADVWAGIGGRSRVSNRRGERSVFDAPPVGGRVAPEVRSFSRGSRVRSDTPPRLPADSRPARCEARLRSPSCRAARSLRPAAPWPPRSVAMPTAGAHRLPKAPGCPILPQEQRVQPARRPAAAGRELADARQLDRPRRALPRRLRLGHLRRRADRDPVHRGAQDPEEGAGDVRVRRRVRPRPLSDPARTRRSRAARTPTATATCSSSTATAAGSTSSSTPARATAARAGRRAPARSSTCARTGCAPPAGRRPTPPGLPILPGLARYHEVARGSIDHALRFTARRTRRAYVYPARHFASERQRPGAAADGPARASEGERQPRRARPPGEGRRAGAQALRRAARRQRLAVVLQRRARPALGQRRPAHARPPDRQRLRGRRHVVAACARGGRSRCVAERLAPREPFAGRLGARAARIEHAVDAVLAADGRRGAGCRRRRTSASSSARSSSCASQPQLARGGADRLDHALEQLGDRPQAIVLVGQRRRDALARGAERRLVEQLRGRALDRPRRATRAAPATARRRPARRCGAAASCVSSARISTVPMRGCGRSFHQWNV